MEPETVSPALPRRHGGSLAVLDRPSAESSAEPTGLSTPNTNLIVFAHDSEREFARILDFYQIQWRYEPTSFPIRWDPQGRPIESFTPDFYLPELELYVELTTLRQSLVTKKNRKLRRLRELYPDINIKLFYNRDVKFLFAKYRKPTPVESAEA